MSTPDPCCAMLTELSACAYRLGLVFAAEAERAEAMKAKLEYFQLFDRCFFSVRVATALKLRLRREPVAMSERFSEREAEREALRDPPERDGPPERAREYEGALEYDRDREIERASLPGLIRTLKNVVADAAALPGPEPAALAPLRALLDPAAPSAVRASGRASKPPDLRMRLAASTTTAGPGSALLAAHFAGQTVRRATGPPRR